jgi:predicted phosphodiesterase
MRPARRWLPLAAIAALVAIVLLAGAADPRRQEPATAGPAEVTAPKASEGTIQLPQVKDSLKFITLGDFGDGSKLEYSLAKQMVNYYKQFKFDLVVTVGDNLYGGERPQDFVRKFEVPYKTLLDAKVKFYGCLGNHDSREQRYYKPFNMDGKLYYTLKAPHENVRFYILDSTYPVPEQIEWLEKELRETNEDWKIAVFHHPLYSSGGRHGSDVKLRQALEPLFVKYNVSVALTGHDHFYERIKPQKGIVHFVVGSGGRLAIGDINAGTGLTAKGYDTDNVFLAVEITGDKFFFNAVSSTGQVIDSGIIERRKPGEVVKE